MFYTQKNQEKASECALKEEVGAWIFLQLLTFRKRVLED
jgi:hypothetical protein